MSQFVFKMPDLGEGTVDAEIVAWHTKPGDAVTEDQLIVEVMTDKAAVEVPAPVSGRVVSITGAPGDKVVVGSPLIVFEVGEGAVANGGAAQPPAATPPARPVDTAPGNAPSSSAAVAPSPPTAAPAPSAAPAAQIAPSPVNGFCFCQGTFAEMGIDIPATIRRLAVERRGTMTLPRNSGHLW